MIRQIAKSELIKNYAGAIAILLGTLPAIGSLAISITTILRGEPYAEKTWSTLRKQVDEQTVEINTINTKIAKLESLQEGIQLGKLQGELETLQKLYIQERKSPKTSVKKCPMGFSWIKDQCQKTPAASSQPPKEDEQKRLEDTQKLIKDYMKQQKSMSKKAPRKLQQLPDNP